MRTALPPALQCLITGSAPLPVAKGQCLVQPGTSVDRVWVIDHGLLRRYSLGAEGGEFTHDFLGPGDWACAQLELSDGRLCCAQAALAIEALQASSVRALALADLNSLCLSDSASAAYLFEQSLRHSSQRIEREAGLAHASAESRYLSLLAAQPGIEATLSQKQIATWLGITPVALSRIRRRRACR